MGIRLIALLAAAVVVGSGQGSRGHITGTAVNALSGRPVVNATVTVARADSLGRGTTTTTNQDGGFSFAGLQEGTEYVINGRAPGFLLGDYSQLNADPRFTPAWVALPIAEPRQNARLRLWPEASISGSVKDANGRPITNIPVRALVKVSIGGTEVIANSVTVLTDDTGRYRIPQLQERQYFISVLPLAASALPLAGGDGRTPARPQRPASGGLASYPTSAVSGVGATYGAAFFEGAQDVTSARMLSPSLGEELPNVDFRVRAVLGRTVAGTVSGLSGDPKTTVLRLVPKGSERLGYGSEVAVARPTSGRFVIERVPPGDYTLLLHSNFSEFMTWEATPFSAVPGLKTLSGRSALTLTAVTSDLAGVFFGQRMSAIASEWAAVPISVGDHDVLNLQVTVLPTSVFRGTVALDSGSSPPLQPAGGLQFEPSLDNSMLAIAIAEERAGSSNAQERSIRGFEASGLVPGDYYVTTSQPGMAVRSVTLAGRDITYEPIRVSLGSGLDGIEARLTSRTAEIAGVVTDGMGRPLQIGSVLCFPVDSRAWSNHGLSSRRIRLVTVRGGRYVINGLPGGSYYVVAMAGTGASITPANLRSLSQGARKVSVEWASRLDVALQSVIAK